ncbi:site-specific integrase [Methanofollis fontis]|uniref:Integrase n=1 Tax=Methanofollis fontis TaxID=2052832 RepID=A0A483CSV3_9EURY|nr:site-specific integrase [Methanofollis fontis]TAJ43643.1 integrase [Methanofollis fontis]
MHHLVGWRRYLGPYLDNDLTDLLNGINLLRCGTSRRGTPYKQNTIRDYVTILKQFYRWLAFKEYIDISTEKLRRIKTPAKDRMTKTAADLLSPSEVERVIAAARSVRDRALVTTLYEGGFRAGEIGTLTWGNLVFDQNGVVANVNFKTNRPRYIRLVLAREPLIQWRSVYPFRAEGDNLVFLSRSNKALTYAAVAALLREVVKRAGLGRHVTPHTFRHSRITHMIQEGYPETVIKLMMWGTVAATEFATYTHLTGCDIDRAVLEKNGIVGGGELWQGVEGVKCQYCEIVNPPAARYCYSCGRPMNAEDVMNELKTLLKANPAVVRVLMDSAREG